MEQQPLSFQQQAVMNVLYGSFATLRLDYFAKMPRRKIYPAA
jgi:hypothetical protein